MSEQVQDAQRLVEGPGVPERERFLAIDVVRGFALLGILLVNIQSFAMIGDAYINPKAFGDLQGGNYWAWYLTHVFAEQKFLSLFSILFGAGIALMTLRRETRGESLTRIHYRRMALLLAFGLAHAYLIWFGDILVAYSLCGMLVFPLRRLSPRALLIVGFLMIGVHSLLYTGMYQIMQAVPQAREAMNADMTPTAQEVEEELAAYRGPWIGQLPYRALMAVVLQTLVFGLWTVWRAGGLMLVGMALLKLDIVSARRPAALYWAMALVGAAIGFPVIVYGQVLVARHGHDPVFAMLIGEQFNYWGSLFVALAYLGLVMLVCKAGVRALTVPLCAVGRLAFTNYLMQSVICTTVFYGHGFGLFGRLDRVQQLGVVVGVWVFQIFFSLLWLHYFQIGPMEWLWRALTYGSLPRWRREALVA